MARMTIRTTNSTFESVSDDGDFASIDDAYRSAVLAGLQIASDEVAEGAAVAIVEVAVDVGNHRYAARGAVSVSTSRIKATAE